MPNRHRESFLKSCKPLGVFGISPAAGPAVTSRRAQPVKDIAVGQPHRCDQKIILQHRHVGHGGPTDGRGQAEGLLERKAAAVVRPRQRKLAGIGLGQLDRRNGDHRNPGRKFRRVVGGVSGGGGVANKVRGLTFLARPKSLTRARNPSAS